MSDEPSGELPASQPEADGSQQAGSRRPRRAAAERGASWRHEFEQRQWEEDALRQARALGRAAS